MYCSNIIHDFECFFSEGFICGTNKGIGDCLIEILILINCIITMLVELFRMFFLLLVAIVEVIEMLILMVNILH